MSYWKAYAVDDAGNVEDKERRVPDFNWHVKLLIDNDEGWYNEVTEAARQQVEDFAGNDWALAEYLHDMVLEMTEDDEDNGHIMSSELLMCAINAVDWNELSASYMEDAREALEYKGK